MSDPFPHHKRDSETNWITPPDVLANIEHEFGKCFDPCPIGGTDGLDIAWQNPAFVNPPWNNIGPWIHKAIQEWQDGKTIVMLVPNCQYAKWFRTHVPDVRVFHHRLRYHTPEGRPATSYNGDVLLIYRGA